jgi:TolA-binding protein
MIVELHPEELLDRESSGTLTDAERRALDAHSARCAACGCERRLRSEFAEVMGESESESERARGSVSVSGVVRGRWGRYAAWLGVAAVLVGGAAAAQHAARTAAVTEQREERAAVVRSGERIRASAARVGPRVRLAKRAAAVAVGRRREPGAPVLFEDANRARMRGEYAKSVDTYRRLQQRYPASREARVSYATMGRMQLDHGDAAGALGTFALYEPAGDRELDEVVMAGRALAFEQLGAARIASRAWAVLLEAHPDSPYAEHARARASGLAL